MKVTVGMDLGPDDTSMDLIHGYAAEVARTLCHMIRVMEVQPTHDAVRYRLVPTSVSVEVEVPGEKDVRQYVVRWYARKNPTSS
jgi:hypothetical protein